jgi:hypothetical protein
MPKKVAFDPKVEQATEQARKAEESAKKEAKQKEKEEKKAAKQKERKPSKKAQAAPWEGEAERQAAEAKVLEAASFDLAKERALEELSRYALATWAEYGVPETALTDEMTKPVLVSIDDTGKHFEERERGIGVTLAINLERRAQAIRDAQGVAALSTALTKAKNSVHTSALYLWAKGKARGPATTQNLTKLAKKAENLAEHLEGLAGQATTPEEMEKLHKQSDQQRARAASIRSGIVPVKEKKADRQPRPCLCGCGKLTKGSFAPGHDSKVHSTILKIARGQLKGTMPTEVVEYVRNSKWLNEQEMQAFLESQPK